MIPTKCRRDLARMGYFLSLKRGWTSYLIFLLEKNSIVREKGDCDAIWPVEGVVRFPSTTLLSMKVEATRRK